jgi:large repetitive protein
MVRSTRRLLVPVAALLAGVLLLAGAVLAQPAYSDSGSGGDGGDGGSASSASTLTISTPSTLPNAHVGTQYTAYIEASGGEGGPIRWKLVSGSVPEGLRFVGDDFRLTQTTGVVGTPRTVQTRTFTVEAEDAADNTARKTFSITVDPALPLQVTNGSDVLAAGRVGQSYATSLFANGGVRPYTWAVVSGALPPGLGLSGNVISGTPSTAGSFGFTAQVTDSAGSRASQAFTINVSP